MSIVSSMMAGKFLGGNSTPQEQAATIMKSLASTQAELDKITATLTAKVNTLRATQEGNISKLESRISELKSELETLAEMNREDLCPGSKKHQNAYGHFGYHKSAGKVQVVEGKTEEEAIKTLEELAPGWVKTKLSLDKTRIKNEADGEEANEAMAAAGLEIVSPVSFKINLKKEGGR